MPTIINNPPHNGEGGAVVAIVTGIVVVVLVLIFFLYGLPRIRGTNNPRVNLPDGINVNPGGGNQ